MGVKPRRHDREVTEISTRRLERERALYKRAVLAFYDVVEGRQYLERMQANAVASSYDDVAHDAFVTAFVISYGRCFTDSRSGPGVLNRLPERFARSLDVDEFAMHQRLLDLRNTQFAHSDNDAAKVEVSLAASPAHLLVPSSRGLRRGSIDPTTLPIAGRVLEKLYVFVYEELMRLNSLLAPHGKF